MSKSFTLQIWRGNESNLPTLSAGEFGLAEDTNKLYIGTSGGNIQVADLSTIGSGTLSDLISALTNVSNIITNNADEFDSFTEVSGSNLWGQDRILIEDYSDSLNKKYVDFSSVVTLVRSYLGLHHINTGNYEGNGNNNRTINTGHDFDEAWIWLDENRDYKNKHLAFAHYINGINMVVQGGSGSQNGTECRTGSYADDYFQGKYSSIYLYLGSSGSDIRGANYNGWTYRWKSVKYS